MTIDDPIRNMVTCTAVVTWLYFVLPRLPLLALRVVGPPAQLAIALAIALGSYGVHVAMLCMASVSGYVLLTDPVVVHGASTGTDSLFDFLVGLYTIGASILVMCSDFAFFCASQIGL
jgi:hypothetical protein